MPTVKWTKAPKRLNGIGASSTDPKTWATLEQVIDTYLRQPRAGLQRDKSGALSDDARRYCFDGVGIMCTTLSEFGQIIVVIDIDHKRAFEDGQLTPFALEVIVALRLLYEI